MHDTRGGKVAPVDGQQRKGEVLLWASLRKGLSGAHAAAFLKKGFVDSALVLSTNRC